MNYSWKDCINTQNQDLYEEINSRLPLDLIPNKDDGWASSITNKGRGVIYYADTSYPEASCTHELLHIKLEFIQGAARPFYCPNTVSKDDVGYFHNQLSHHKFFPEFSRLQFPAEQFLADSDVDEAYTQLDKDISHMEKQYSEHLVSPSKYKFLFPYLSASSPHDQSRKVRHFRERLRNLRERPDWEMIDLILKFWTVSDDFNIYRPMAQLFQIADMPEFRFGSIPDRAQMVQAGTVDLPTRKG